MAEKEPATEEAAISEEKREGARSLLTPTTENAEPGVKDAAEKVKAARKKRAAKRASRGGLNADRAAPRDPKPTKKNQKNLKKRLLEPGVVIDRRGKNQKPASLPLPPPGQQRALDLLAMAGKLADMPVYVPASRLLERSIHINPEVAGADVTLLELRLLLAAHRLYLFEHVHPVQGKRLVVSTRRSWQPEAPRYRAVIAVRPGRRFEKVWAALSSAVEAHNDALPPGAGPVVAVPAPRVGKIFVRSPRKNDIEQLEVLVGKKDRANPDHPKLFTHLAQFVLAEKLAEEVLSSLTPGERKRIKIVPSSKGNRLLFRSPPKLARKVKAILRELDHRGRLQEQRPKTERKVEPRSGRSVRPRPN